MLLLTLAHLRRLVPGAGLANPVPERLVASEEQAHRERFLGSMLESPTLES